jgi:hypothetical protein
MQVKYDALMKKQNWVLEDLPVDKKPIGCKWVYSVKYKANGTLDKHKASLVGKGFDQQEGRDYD